MKTATSLILTGVMLLGGMAAIQAQPATPGGWDQVAPTKPKRVLFFTKSSGFEHSVIKRTAPDQLGYAEKILADLGAKHNFQVTCSKDGSVFTPENIAKFDVFVFYTSGMLTEAGTDKTPPMTEAGKAALLQAIRNGKGFVGTHSSSDCFHVQPDATDKSARFVSNPEKADPFIAMLGGEFIRHGPQQTATMLVMDNKFPGFESLNNSFSLHEEWYTLKNFAPDMHVLLVQQTKGMTGIDYQRANYPDTWARFNGKGRVFYTAMGHREDVWTNPLYQNILLGAIGWTAGNVTADVTPNLEKAAPGHREIQPKDPPPKAKKQ